jgi:hypothetical protein
LTAVLRRNIVECELDDNFLLGLETLLIQTSSVVSSEIPVRDGTEPEAEILTHPAQVCGTKYRCSRAAYTVQACTVKLT